jgi:hypothetical protein
MKEGTVKTVLLGPWSIRTEYRGNKRGCEVKTKNVITGRKEYVRKLQKHEGHPVRGTGRMEEDSGRKDAERPADDTLGNQEAV